MKVSTSRIDIRIKRQFVITENHPLVHMAYSSPPKKVLVERGEIEYTWKNGRWVVHSNYSVNVGGKVLKQSGTPGKNDHTRAAPSKYDREPGWPWLNEIIEMLRPTGDLAMVTLTEHEVSE